MTRPWQRGDDPDQAPLGQPIDQSGIPVDWAWILEEVGETFADLQAHYQAASQPWREAVVVRELQRVTAEAVRCGSSVTDAELALLHAEQQPVHHAYEDAG